MRRLLVVLAILAVVLGPLFSGLAPAAIAIDSADVHSCARTYDTPQYDQLASYIWPEHASPLSSVELDVVAGQRSVDGRSHDGLARQQANVTAGVYVYDGTALLTHVARSGAIKVEGTPGSDRDPSMLPLGSTAAKSADEVVDVGHAGIHQFPGIKAGKSQFFDAENLGKLSDTSSLSGTLQKNGNTRYVLKRGSDVGVDRTTGLPTNVYTVIRKPDGSVLTMFPGTSPKS